MRLLLAAVGKLRSNDPIANLIDDYATRIEKTGKGLGFTRLEIKSFEAPRGLSGPACQARESELLLNAIPEKAFLILLDEKGDNLTSTKFARKLESVRDSGSGVIAFAIGGADGHGDMIRQRANASLAFGPATWPHMMARLMVCEQIYRAMTILSGHPYHRE